MHSLVKRTKRLLNLNVKETKTFLNLAKHQKQIVKKTSSYISFTFQKVRRLCLRTVKTHQYQI